MLKKLTRNNRTLFQKIIIPLITVMVFQSIIFFCAALFGGVIDTLEQNAQDVLKERIINRQLDIETTFNSHWTDLESSVAAINGHYDVLKKDSETPFYKNVELQKKLLTTVYLNLISTLRTNSVTGVFIILNNSEEYIRSHADETQKYYGLCVRDYDPSSTYSGREDLLVARCPSSMIGTLGCSVDSCWEAFYTFDGNNESDYFYKPLEQAYKNPGTDYDNLAYLCSLHSFGTSDRKVISYSVPLIDEDGHTYGVLGVEMTSDYLKTFIPASSLYGKNAGCYALVEYEDGSQTYNIVSLNGVLFQQAFADSVSFNATTNASGILECQGELNGVEICGYACDLQIYNHNTPFENEKLAIVGLVKSDALYSITTMVKNRLFYASVVVLIIGTITVLIICRRITRPIKKLSNKVRMTEVNSAPALDRINITEIDELVSSIETLSEKVNRNMVRTEFFSRMSHDMRTPMNAIIGFSSSELMEEASIEQMRDYMDKVHSSGEYLLGLINEVLDMTKIEAERMELRFEAVEASKVWSNVTDMINEVAKEKQVTFNADIDTSDCVIMADRRHLNKMLMNLLSNAVKFTPPGGRVDYNVQEFERSENEVKYTIIVSDTGCGMSDEFMKKMYEPFTQENPGHGGTGLGLAIARQIVSLMNGTLTCESHVGMGTVFKATISFELAPKDAMISDDGSAHERAVNIDTVSVHLENKHILLCEDHPLNSQIAVHLLERKGVTVDVAVNGKKGLEMFSESKEGDYDLVLMDIRMPVMDGLEAARAIRALERADAKTIPIIAMTANAFADDVERSKNAGMNEHLSKPIDPTILYVTLDKYL